VAKSHHHHTREQTRRNTPRRRPYTPTGLGGGSFRTSSGCSKPTDADAGRTDVSVDPARRNDRRSSRRRRQRPRRRSLTLRLALQPLLNDRVDSTPLQADSPGSAFVPRTVRQSPTTLRLSLQPLQTTVSSHLQRRPSVPVRPGDRSALVPAVAYDGDLVVSQRSLAPVSSGEPTQHPAFLRNSALEPQFPTASGGSTHGAKLPLRLTQSIRLGAISLSAHC